MTGKRLDIQQSTHVISLAETLCDCHTVFIHYIDDLLNSSIYPCQLTLEQQAPLEILNLTADIRVNHSVFLKQNK